MLFISKHFLNAMSKACLESSSTDLELLHICADIENESKPLCQPSRIKH